MLDKLSEALRTSMRKFISAIFIDEKTINAFVNEIQKALIQSDVEIKLIFKIIPFYLNINLSPVQKRKISPLR